MTTLAKAQAGAAAGPESGKCVTCRHFKHIEPGFSDWLVCLNPALRPLGKDGWEIPWTPNFDYGCTFWQPFPTQEVTL